VVFGGEIFPQRLKPDLFSIIHVRAEARTLHGLNRLRKKNIILKGTAYLAAASIRPYVNACNLFGFSR
jgi:hypothetical protein